MLGLLRQFSGYTLTSLREESTDLLRLVNIEGQGRREAN